MRANKNFLCLVKFNEVSCMFALIDCVVVACVCCLWNNIVNWHDPCALVIMSFQILLSIWQNHYLSNLSYFNWFLFYFKNKEPRFFFDTKFFQSIYIFNLWGIYRESNPYFIKLWFYKPLISGFQTPLRKLDKGNIDVSTSFWKYLQKLYSIISNSLSTSPWHDICWALVCSDARLVANV
jgi:hypothetical protein